MKPNQVFTINDLTTPGFIESMASQSGDCEVVFDNRKRVVMPTRLALINGIFWDVYRAFNVNVNPDKIFWIETFTDETTNKCGTKIYREFVLEKRYQDHLSVLASIWTAMNRLFRFIHKNCREYQETIDAWALDMLCMQDAMTEVCTRPIDERLGTRMGEKLHTQITNDLYKILSDPKKVPYNPIDWAMKTKILKRNQLPQMFCAYGPRSDIDDSMMKHIINANAFSGLESIADFATEYLSAKKAQFFNNNVIRKAQYFARRLRLGGSRLPKIYPGWCGSTFLLPYTIPAKYKKNFIGNYIKVTREEFKKFDTDKIHLYDDCSIMLTPENIDYFVDKEVKFWSPFGCRHTDGICEHCAGFMNQHALAFCPPGIQFGVFTATRFASVVTQKILSAKHLIKTTSKDVVLSPLALKYFSKSSDAIHWQAANIGTLKKGYARLAVTDIGPTSDLQHSPLPSGEAWSSIDCVGIVGSKGNLMDEVVLTDWSTHPYLSNYMMTYLRDHFKELVVRSEYIDIPLKDYDFSKPFMLVTAVNDDMVSYVTGVDKFLCSKICDYHSLTDCTKDFTELVYNKADINFFYIQTLLRAFLVTKSGEHSIPVLKDPNQPVEFDRMAAMISESALSTKLSFERLEELFDRPEPTLLDRGGGYGMNDAFFGWLKEK